MLYNTDYGAVQVVSVAGTSVTLDLITVYKNGTGSSQGVLLDVATGSSNITALTTGPSAAYFVLAGGLQAGDTIWNTANAPRLNGTVTETVLGSSRVLNILNFTTTTNMNGLSLTSKYGFAWDQPSGVFVEFSFDISSSYYFNGQSGSSEIGLVIGMVDNNIWYSPGSSSLPDFGIDASPATLTVTQGTSGNVTVNIVRIKGFSAIVSLTVTTSSSAITCSITPNKLYMGGSDTAKLSCNGSPGSYTVTVKGDSGYSTHTKTVTLNIVSLPDFGIDAGPATLTVSPPGVSGNVTVSIVRINGFSATVSLTVTTSSSDITCTLTPNKLYMGGSDTAKLSCHGSLGTYTVTVKGDSGYSTHTKTVTMNVVSTPPSSSTQPSNDIQMILIYAGIAAAAVIGATIAVLLLRKKGPEQMAAPSDTPVPPTPPTQP
jgi:hypothetical protein